MDTAPNRPVDVVIVGGGIVGMATAAALLDQTQAALVLIEKEPRIASHQTGRNSGVIHSGLYYRPGSAKARLCVEGREAMYRFCSDNDIPFERCGKVVVATDHSELSRLDDLERRGRANGLSGLRRLGPEELRELEPHAAGIAALHVPETGIVDFERVTHVLADRIRGHGGEVVTGAEFRGLRREPSGLVVESTAGRIRCRRLVNCAGLHADRVARRCGVRPEIRIVPFRGEYYELVAHRRSLVRNLIYPVPDPSFPFLGVHFTRRIDGRVEAGPNAVLALEREGYRWRDLSVRDLAEVLAYPGFWRLAARYMKTGLAEMWRSASRRAFARSLAQLVPEVRMQDLAVAGSGVRAQALAPDGELLDDFHIVEAPDMLHVLNAPSPAATAALGIGAELARRALAAFEL
jgi:L-2-hydroxyglutarate oxidase